MGKSAIEIVRWKIRLFLQNSNVSFFEELREVENKSRSQVVILVVSSR